MITVVTPKDPAPGHLRRFGPLAESLLRKHGWISVRTLSAEHGDDGATRDDLLVVPCPEATPNVERCASLIVDGPIPHDLAARLGIRAEDHEAQGLQIVDDSGRPLGTVVRPAMDVREIPVSRDIRSDPYPFRSSHPCWAPTPISYQSLEPGGAWRPLLWGAPLDGSRPAVPVCLGDGRRVVLGMPLLDVSMGQSAFPPLDAGYWAHTTAPATFALECWLADRIGTLLGTARLSGVRIGRWPSGCSAALTVRHDYDRLIPDASLNELLGHYERLGLRSTWGFLIDKAPRAHADQIERAGHEVMLHSVARNEAELKAERDTLAERTGRWALGSTAHGGLGAPGYLGGRHFEWAERTGMRYSEMLGCALGLPAQAVVERDGLPVVSTILLPNQHSSLDISTKPDGHAFDRLAAECPQAIERGEHLVVMNHPDIHRTELIELLARIARPHVWRATFRDVISWSAAAKFGARLGQGRDTVTFGAPLPAPTLIETFTVDGRRIETQAPVGSRGIALEGLGHRSEAIT